MSASAPVDQNPKQPRADLIGALALAKEPEASYEGVLQDILSFNSVSEEVAGIPGESSLIAFHDDAVCRVIPRQDSRNQGGVTVIHTIPTSGGRHGSHFEGCEVR